MVVGSNPKRGADFLLPLVPVSQSPTTEEPSTGTRPRCIRRRARRPRISSPDLNTPPPSTLKALVLITVTFQRSEDIFHVVLPE